MNNETFEDALIKDWQHSDLTNDDVFIARFVVSCKGSIPDSETTSDTCKQLEDYVVWQLRKKVEDMVCDSLKKENERLRELLKEMVLRLKSYDSYEGDMAEYRCRISKLGVKI